MVGFRASHCSLDTDGFAHFGLSGVGDLDRNPGSFGVCGGNVGVAVSCFGGSVGVAVLGLGVSVGIAVPCSTGAEVVSLGWMWPAEQL